MGQKMVLTLVQVLYINHDDDKPTSQKPYLNLLCLRRFVFYPLVDIFIYICFYRPLREQKYANQKYVNASKFEWFTYCIHRAKIDPFHDFQMYEIATKFGNVSIFL